MFNREVDEETVLNNFFITGPDQDTWSGPDQLIWNNRIENGDEEEILQSPGYRGLLQGTISFERIKFGSYDSYSGYDDSGLGNLFRTKAIFTPTNKLAPNTLYTVYISGDEDTTDSYDTGIRTRTVFDTITGGANTGTGTLLFGGSYTGSASTDSITLTIQTGGEPGTAEYVWHLGSAPTLIHGPYRTNLKTIEIVDGVTVLFGAEGSFDIGDNFSVVIKAPTLFSGNLFWPFTTGSGSIETLPTSTSTTILGEEAGALPTFDYLSVLSTDPDNRDTNLADWVDQDATITINFNSALDGSTIDSSSVEVNVEAVNGDSIHIAASGIVPTTLTPTGSQLQILVPSGYVHGNNSVTVTLDSSIADTSGHTLLEDYEFYFTAEYSPLYSSVKKVRSEYGAFLQEIFDDTINLAIFEASQAATNLTWATATGSTLESYYEWVRWEFTTCKAAEVLLNNVLGASNGLKRKKLGDLEVEYDSKALYNGLERALGCLAKWELTMNGRGGARQKPGISIFGYADPDRPPIGRGWNSPGDNSGIPVANSKSITNYRYRSGFYSPYPGGRTGKGK